MRVVVSTPHLAIKFSSVTSNVFTIHGNQKLVRECYVANMQPQESALAAINVERTLGPDKALAGEDIDLKVECDSKIEKKLCTKQ